MGGAKNLLYGLKNRMKLGGLKSLQTYRDYPDGTRIIVRSVFGMDYVEIISGAITPSCTIKLYDDNHTLLHLPPPKVVPPMKWYELDTGQEEHHKELRVYDKTSKTLSIKNPEGEEEVEGYDYIKTYYSWTTQDCPSCSPLGLTVAKGNDSWRLTATSPNRPFWYASEKDDGTLIYSYNGIMVPHYIGYTTDLGVVIPDNPLNHTIYSFSGCQAEILEVSVYADGVNTGKTTFFMSDDQGSYFVWKAYTEWTNNGPIDFFGVPIIFSRNGLGYMLMKGTITNGGLVLCESKPTIIKVDCCEKIADERQVILWWESLGGHEKGGPTCVGQPFIFYGSITICEVPDEVAGLYALLCTGPGPGAKYFYVIPEIKGGCLPFIWSVSNQSFNLISSKPFGETGTLTYKHCPDIYDFDEASALCHETVTVTVTDRCGTTDKVRFISCCEQAEKDENVPVITYTSLSMGCGQTQTLGAGGGCGSYSWSSSGSGSLNTTQGSAVEYTAPASNANCGNNDSITVTDCCGGSTTITLFVSCNPAGTAYRRCDWIVCVPCVWIPDYMCTGKADFQAQTYNCDGTLIALTPSNACSPGFDCAGCISLMCGNAEGCPNEWSDWTTPCGGSGWGACANPNQACGTVMDIRSSAMKAAGCCPINPDTGLPF